MSKNNGKWHSDDFGKKVKNTKKLHFGNENFVNVEKIKTTHLERYGFFNTNPEKRARTKQLKYNDPNYNNRDKFKNTL